MTVVTNTRSRPQFQIMEKKNLENYLQWQVSVNNRFQNR